MSCHLNMTLPRAMVITYKHTRSLSFYF